MSNPSPKRPNKLTVNVSADGLMSDYLYEVYQSDPMSDDLKAYLERRRRERREARERAAQNPPSGEDKPAE
jgi:hypothetical protein